MAICAFPFTLRNMMNTKCRNIWEEGVNKIAFAALYDTAKGEALTEGSKDLCQAIKMPMGGCRSPFYPGKTGKQY